MSTVDTSIYLVLHTVINSLLKNVLTKCVGQYFSKISFSNKVWFCPDIFSWFLFGQPLPIFVVLIFFSKESRFQKCLLFFNPRLRHLWSRVQQNLPDEKSVGDRQTWESNRGQQWLSRTGQIKICQGCSWGQNFDWFWEKKGDFFDRTSNVRAACWKKTDKWSLWSTAAGDKEVEWLQ